MSRHRHSWRYLYETTWTGQTGWYKIYECECGMLRRDIVVGKRKLEEYHYFAH